MTAPGPVQRAVSPTYNATGISASIAAIYACVVMIIHATQHTGIIDPQVILAAIGAALFLYSRFKVTPVADPKTADGVPLVPKPPV
jgi:hypothetical protein